MGRPFAYLRKSRVNNLDASLAPETQERTVREMAQRFGDNGDRLHVLADWDISGAAKYTRKRAGYLELVKVGMITSSGPTVIIRTGPTPDRWIDLRSGR